MSKSISEIAREQALEAFPGYYITTKTNRDRCEQACRAAIEAWDAQAEVRE